MSFIRVCDEYDPELGKVLRAKKSQANQRRRVRSRKLELVEMKGGSCETCGYDRFWGALEFHHVNRDEKDFEVGQQLHKSQKYFEEKVIPEVRDKCILLCANCHRELHGKRLEKYDTLYRE